MKRTTHGVVVNFASFVCAVIFLCGSFLSGTDAQAQSAPQTLFTSQLPSSPNLFSSFRYELGMKFRSTKPGKITALRFYKSASDTSTHIGRLWSATGAQLASVTFTGESTSGWQQKALTTPINIAANTTYVVSVNVGTPSGSFYPRTLNGLATAVTNGDLQSVVGGNGVYGAVGSFPISSNLNTNYFRDVVFVANAAPTIAKVSGDNQTAAAGSPLTNALVVQVRNGSNVPVSGAAVTFAVTGGGGTVAPTAAVTDVNGNASTVLTLGSAVGTNTVSVSASATGTGSVTFTATGTVASVIGQQVFSTQVPASPDATDGVSYELGMKFRTTRSGRISALRYWKAPSESGARIGHIWDSSGTLLGSVTFTGETASGWQQQALTTPISIVANTTYIVSVNVVSHFAITGSSLATSIVNGDLSTVADGANGVYGSSGTFPTNSFQNSNYFRDVVFIADAGVSTIAKVSGDNQSAVAGALLPNPLVVQVRNSSNVAISGASISFAVIAGGGVLTTTSAVTDASGNASTTFRLGSTAGVNSVTATASGIGSVTFAATGTSSVSTQQIFTTQVPALLDANDGVSYELGMKFRSTRSGKISALRYWKAPSDGGVHVGRIWDSAGTLVASVTFTGETASGWQQQAFLTPISIAASTTYMVSVNINTNYAFSSSGLATSVVNGDLSTVADGANGAYGNSGIFPTNSFQNSNYFRDIVFTPDAGVSTISKVSGDSQTGLPGGALASPLVVQVNDANNIPRAGVTVTFAVTSGGGTVSPVSVVTGANGRASTNLTLGATAGVNIVSATAAGIGSVTFSAIGGANAIMLENQKAGTSAWRINNYGIADISGYASALSVPRGGSLPIKVSVAAAGTYTIDVYRIGYYGGTGGRLMASSGNLSGVTQAICPVTDAVTHLVQCSWNTSYTLAVGVDWTTGLYLAKLKLASTGKESPIFFVVRDDASTSQILFQSAFTTSAAYNSYGGYSLYQYSSIASQRAFKVSFDRPTTELQEYSNHLRYEYNMIRWLESQGYDVSYVTNLDIHTTPSLLAQHKVFLDAGHDEYWSLEMRNAVESARDSGMHLAFFSANTAYWRVRFEPSNSGVANRVMVCYKSTDVPDPIAPTYRFRDAPNNRPENALLGVMYIGDTNDLSGFDFVVSNASDPYYANTGLNNGDKLIGLVGYEWDAIVNNGFTPSGVVTLGSSVVTPNGAIAPGIPVTATQISNAVRYTAPSGAKVFSTGSIQWVWGLDDDHGLPYFVSPRVDTRAQQIFVNVLGGMGVRPTTPKPGLVIP